MLIGEVSKATGLTKDTIRFYTRIGMIKAEQLPAGNTFYADYSDETVEFLKEIPFAKAIGMTLNEIKVLMPSAYEGTLTDDDIKKLLETKLAAARAKIEELKKIETILIDKLQNYDIQKRHNNKKSK